MRERPVTVRLWDAYSSINHQENMINIFQKSTYLSSSKRRLLPKYYSFDARGYGIQKEGVKFTLERWSLCSYSKLYNTFQREKDHGQRRRAYQLS